MRHDVGDGCLWVSTGLERVRESFPRRVRLPVAGDERPLRDVVPAWRWCEHRTKYLPALSH
jgi:hypothetical protein